MSRTVPHLVVFVIIDAEWLNPFYILVFACDASHPGKIFLHLPNAVNVKLGREVLVQFRYY